MFFDVESNYTYTCNYWKMLDRSLKSIDVFFFLQISIVVLVLDHWLFYVNGYNNNRSVHLELKLIYE